SSSRLTIGGGTVHRGSYLASATEQYVELDQVEQWPSPLAGLCCDRWERRPIMPDGNDLFEIMQTTRSMRRLKADPVPDALINKILEAGSCAANGGNTQRWRFRG